MILICQCDCHPRNPSGILNETFQTVLFLFSDRCLLRTLPHKENNGEEHCSCFTTIRSKAKQEDKIVTCVTLREPVHGVQWVAVVYVQYMCKASWQESVWVHTMVETGFDWHCIPIITTLPQHYPCSPLIWLPLQRNEGQRAREACAPHMLDRMTSPWSEKLQHGKETWAGRAFLNYINTEDGPHRAKYPKTEHTWAIIWRGKRRSQSGCLTKECMQACPCVNWS